MRYLFSDCELDTECYELRRHGRPVPLGPKVFDVLLYLIRHRDQVVSKQALFEHLWPQQFVGDAALSRCITLARKAIGDLGGTQPLIRTLYGRGYRFTAEVEEHAGVSPPESATPADLLPSQTGLPVSESPVSVAPVEPTSPTPPPPAWERQQVTVLACALADPTARTDRLSPEMRYRLLRELVELAWQQVQQYEGCMHHVTDDGFVALFGVPKSHEDHAQRALLAAIHLQQCLHQRQTAMQIALPDMLDLRIGVHSGDVVGQPLGDEPHVTYLSVGDTMRLALQVRRLAEPGSIVLSEATARLVQGNVRLKPRGEVALTPHDLPVALFAVLSLDPQPSFLARAAQRPLTRFVGRGREMASVRAVLARLQDGQGQVIGVVGEPGLGKSRLVYEFRRSLLGKAVTYLTGQCVSYGSATPYLPLLDALRRHCGLKQADAADTRTAALYRCLADAGLTLDTYAPYLLHLLGVPDAAGALASLSPQALKVRTFDALLSLLVALSRQAPAVLEIENAHWMDATSEEWLTALVGRLVGLPILLLLTYRPGYRLPWVEKSYVTQLALAPLSSSDSRRVIHEVADTEPLSDTLVEQIVAKARGNPFFLEELAQIAGEWGERESPLVVPDTVQAVLAARLDRLPVAARRVLQSAAVIGQEMPLRLWQASSDLPDDLFHTALAELQDGEFVYELPFAPQPAYCFKHARAQISVGGGLA